MARYDDKKVVITGGTSGMGLATARFLVDEGARVLVTGRSEETLAAARDELGGDAIVLASDAASLPAIDALADRVAAEFGTVDLLFVNAGATTFAPFEETTEEAYDRLLALNAKGPYFTVQKFAQLMPAGSSVVLTTSVVNVMGFPMVSAYSASKAALRSMARTMARELLPRGIRVNAVSPGPIATGILRKTMAADAADEAMAGMAADNPMGRLGDPGEIARAVAFLAFEATFTTGAELPVDGGASQV